jgi:hypothetical protein
MAVLCNYDGNPVVHKVCKELVATLPEDSEYLSEVLTILESTGGIIGEFGYVEAYKQKKLGIAEWLKDSSGRVKVFAEKYNAALDRRMLSEKRRVEESIELRKHIFGDAQ